MSPCASRTQAIYQALYVQSRGALKRELVACLRTGRALRVPRARARQRPGGHVTPEVMISQRPAEATDRAVPGHWERSDHRQRPVRDRHRGRTQHAVHDAAAPAPARRVGCRGAGEERATRWLATALWRCGRRSPLR